MLRAIHSKPFLLPSPSRNLRWGARENSRMRIDKKRLAVLREHIEAESSHNMEGLLDGMTSDCFNDVCCVPKPFVGPKRVAERYRKHWEGFPDFKVRVRRFLAADDKCIVTENEWSGRHLGTFLGLRPSGKRVRVRALVVWHFRGNKLWGETVFFDLGSIQKQIGAKVKVPGRRRARSV
jgi:steroid delta-isomerase-like uncharacterized protein